MRIAWVEPGPGTDHERIWPLVFLAGLVLVKLEAWLPPGLHLWCPLKTLTGVPCPGCGTTRAMRALLALDPAAAFRWNPLGTVAGLLAGAFAAYAVMALFFRTPRLRVLEMTRAERAAAWLLVVANWAWLIADGR